MLKPSVSYVGNRYGLLVVTALGEPDRFRHVRLLCKCDCGADYLALAQNIKSGYSLKSGKPVDCGCTRKAEKQARTREVVRAKAKRLAAQDARIGAQYNRLTVISLVQRKGRKKYNCRCECGNAVVASYSALCENSKRDCGCAKLAKYPKQDSGFRLVYTAYTHRQKVRGFGSLLITAEQFKQLTSKPCTYCGAMRSAIQKGLTEGADYAYNGLDRVNTLLGYSLDNVVPCCVTCNRMKLDYTREDFLNKVRLIAATHPRPERTP